LKNKKEKEEKNKQPQKSAEALIVDSESDGNVLCVTTSNNRYAVEWVLDSGCKYHMCPYREWFSTYKPLDSGVVLMGMMPNVMWLVLAQCKSKHVMVL